MRKVASPYKNRSPRPSHLTGPARMGGTRIEGCAPVEHPPSGRTGAICKHHCHQPYAICVNCGKEYCIKGAMESIAIRGGKEQWKSDNLRHDKRPAEYPDGTPVDWDT